MFNFMVCGCVKPAHMLLTSWGDTVLLSTNIRCNVWVKNLLLDLYKFYATCVHSQYTGLLTRFESVTENLYTVSTPLTTKTIYRYIIKEY